MKKYLVDPSLNPPCAYQAVRAWVEEGEWEVGQDGQFVVHPYWYVMGESLYGLVFIYMGSTEYPGTWVFDSPEAAERHADRVSARGNIDPAYWEHARTVYGSDAYVERGVEAQVVAIESMMDGRPGFRFDPDASRDLWKAM